jgi:hypothetical protein
MPRQKVILYKQMRKDGLIYTIKVENSDEYPIERLPNSEELVKQFFDIAENHCAFTHEHIEKTSIFDTAAQQAREYFENRKKPLAVALGL